MSHLDPEFHRLGSAGRIQTPVVSLDSSVRETLCFAREKLLQYAAANVDPDESERENLRRSLSLLRIMPSARGDVPIVELLNPSRHHTDDDSYNNLVDVIDKERRLTTRNILKWSCHLAITIMQLHENYMTLGDFSLSDVFVVSDDVVLSALRGHAVIYSQVATNPNSSSGSKQKRSEVSRNAWIDLDAQLQCFAKVQVRGRCSSPNSPIPSSKNLVFESTAEVSSRIASTAANANANANTAALDTSSSKSAVMVDPTVESGRSVRFKRCCRNFDLLLLYDRQKTGQITVDGRNKNRQLIADSYSEWRRDIQVDFSNLGLVVLQLTIHQVLTEREKLKLISELNRCCEAIRFRVLQSESDCMAEKTANSTTMAEVTPGFGGMLVASSSQEKVTVSSDDSVGSDKMENGPSVMDMKQQGEAVVKFLMAAYPAVRKLPTVLKELLALCFLPFQKVQTVCESSEAIQIFKTSCIFGETTIKFRATLIRAVIKEYENLAEKPSYWTDADEEMRITSKEKRVSMLREKAKLGPITAAQRIAEEKMKHWMSLQSDDWKAEQARRKLAVVATKKRRLERDKLIKHALLHCSPVHVFQTWMQNAIVAHLQAGVALKAASLVTPPGAKVPPVPEVYVTHQIKDLFALLHPAMCQKILLRYDDEYAIPAEELPKHLNLRQLAQQQKKAAQKLQEPSKKKLENWTNVTPAQIDKCIEILGTEFSVIMNTTCQNQLNHRNTTANLASYAICAHLVDATSEENKLTTTAVESGKLLVISPEQFRYKQLTTRSQLLLRSHKELRKAARVLSDEIETRDRDWTKKLSEIASYALSKQYDLDTLKRYAGEAVAAHRLVGLFRGIRTRKMLRRIWKAALERYSHDFNGANPVPYVDPLREFVILNEKELSTWKHFPPLLVSRIPLVQSKATGMLALEIAFYMRLKTPLPLHEEQQHSECLAQGELACWASLHCAAYIFSSPEDSKGNSVKMGGVALLPPETVLLILYDTQRTPPPPNDKFHPILQSADANEGSTQTLTFTPVHTCCTKRAIKLVTAQRGSPNADYARTAVEINLSGLPSSRTYRIQIVLDRPLSESLWDRNEPFFRAASPIMRGPFNTVPPTATRLPFAEGGPYVPHIGQYVNEGLRWKVGDFPAATLIKLIPPSLSGLLPLFSLQDTVRTVSSRPTAAAKLVITAITYEDHANFGGSGGDGEASGDEASLLGAFVTRDRFEGETNEQSAFPISNNGSTSCLISASPPGQTSEYSRQVTSSPARGPVRRSSSTGSNDSGSCRNKSNRSPDKRESVSSGSGSGGPCRRDSGYGSPSRRSIDLCSDSDRHRSRPKRNAPALQLFLKCLPHACCEKNDLPRRAVAELVMQTQLQWEVSKEDVTTKTHYELDRRTVIVTLAKSSDGRNKRTVLASTPWLARRVNGDERLKTCVYNDTFQFPGENASLESNSASDTGTDVANSPVPVAADIIRIAQGNVLGGNSRNHNHSKNLIPSDQHTDPHTSTILAAAQLHVRRTMVDILLLSSCGCCLADASNALTPISTGDTLGESPCQRGCYPLISTGIYLELEYRMRVVNSCGEGEYCTNVAGLVPSTLLRSVPVACVQIDRVRVEEEGYLKPSRSTGILQHIIGKEAVSKHERREEQTKQQQRRLSAVSGVTSIASASASASASAEAAQRAQTEEEEDMDDNHLLRMLAWSCPLAQ